MDVMTMTWIAVDKIPVNMRKTKKEKLFYRWNLALTASEPKNLGLKSKQIQKIKMKQPVNPILSSL